MTSTPVKILITLIGVVVGAFLLVALAAGFTVSFLWIANVLGLQHALGMDTQSSHNYAAVSGSLPIIVASLGFSTVITGVLKHVNCEQPGCWKPGHRHPDHGRPVCRDHYHHPVVPDLTDEAIQLRMAQVQAQPPINENFDAA